MCEKLPFDKVSEVIDGNGRAHETVAGKDVIYDGSTVILTERRADKCCSFHCLFRDNCHAYCYKDRYIQSNTYCLTAEITCPLSVSISTPLVIRSVLLFTISTKNSILLSQLYINYL